MADDDGFVGATLQRDRPADHGFDAAAYSFFGDLGGDDALEGALEEGLEAPPEEELPDPDLMLDADEDLSYASMFAAALDRGGNDEAAAGAQQEEQLQLLEASLAALSAADEATAPAGGVGAGSLFQDFDLTGPTPPRTKPGSIALGGLLAGTPGSPFGSLPSSSPFGGFGSASAGGAGPSPLGATPQQAQPGADPAVVHMGAPPPVVASLPGSLGAPMGGAPRALTAEELEAQLLGGGSAGQQQQQPPQQQQFQQLLPPQQQGPPFMGMPPPPQHNGYPPMMAPPPPGYGMPPPGHLSPHMQPPPPHHHMRPPMPQQGPPPQYSPGAAFPPMHGRPPPRGPIPMQQPGMFAPGPDMLPPGPGGPQQHMMGPPPRPGMHPPHMRPGPGMPMPPHMRPGPPGPWGQRPPMGMQHPGMQQQRPPHLQHATLAQRLRALDLADRHEEMRRPMLRRRYYSRYMDHEEIEHILAMQWRGLHQGSPYLEDYYYQAFVYKYYAKRNRRSFAPESVRELAPTEKMAPDEVAFVKVEGLGRLPFSNIRRPRPLMDIAPDELRRSKKDGAAGEGAEGDSSAEGGAGGDAGSGSGAGVPARPLEQEPMLAARIMIEDCMCLILDVLDIDQIFVAAAGGAVENEAALRTRRALLMEGLAASLRLPEAAVVPPATPGAGARGSSSGGGGGEVGDGVFLRLMALTKGRKLLGRALRVVYPAPEAAPQQPHSSLVDGELPALPQRPNLRIVWAALRHLRALFAGQSAAASTEDVAVTSGVASAAAEVLRQLHSPEAVADCLAAVVSGDLDGAPLLDTQPDAVLMPLYAPGANAHDAQRPWLVDILTALLQRAAELDLLPATVPADGAQAAAAAWRQQLPRLYALVDRHVSALVEAFQAGMAMGEKEAAAEVKALVPISLVRVLLPHCAREQAAHLRGALQTLGV